MRTLKPGALITACLLALFGFTGCLKDECQNSYTIFRAIYKPLSAVRNEMKWEPARNVENPGKIYLYGKYLLLNDVGRGIHVFDNANPASPQKLGFLNISGNVDMVIRNNVLYADSYADLAVIPVENWNTAKPARFMDRIFADRNYYWNNVSNPDSVQVIVGYERKDTVVDCETAQNLNNCPNCAFADASGRAIFASSSSAAAPVAGVGGSMARFTLVNQYLYAVTSSDLNTIDLTQGLNPVKVRQQPLGWGIETIYPFKDKLFIGSNTGMFIFDLATPSNPMMLSRFNHARVCDPVIADDNFAFVTLRSGTNMCAGNLNQLDVVNIASLTQPNLVKSYPLTNPHGLSKDGNLLFVCDGKDGLRVFDATAPNNLKLLQTIGNMGETFDVIAMNKIALVVGSNGLYQYDYSNPAAIRLLSKVNL